VYWFDQEGLLLGHAPWAVGAAQGPEHPTPVVDEHLPWAGSRRARHPEGYSKPSLALYLINHDKFDLYLITPGVS